MKPTGDVRRVDRLGRVVLPTGVRRDFDIGRKTSIALHRRGQYIVLRRWRPGCTFCSRSEDAMAFRGKLVCRRCVENLLDGRSVN